MGFQDPLAPQPIFVQPPSIDDIVTWTLILAIPTAILAVIAGVGYGIGDAVFNKVAK